MSHSYFQLLIVTENLVRLLCEHQFYNSSVTTMVQGGCGDKGLLNHVLHKVEILNIDVTGLY